MIDTNGLDRLGDSIAKLNRELETSLPGIVMSGAKVVEHEILVRAPQGAGKPVIRLETVAERGKQSASAVVQVEESVEAYAMLQEYGASGTPAHPFFRPGAEAAQPKAESIMTKTIIDKVESHDR